MNPQAEEFRQLIEVETLKIIRELTGKGEEADEKIQQISELVLDLIQPGMSLEQLYSNAVKLDDQHPELAPVVFKIMKAYEQKYEKKAIEEVSIMVKNGNYDETQNMVKKVLQFKIQN